MREITTSGDVLTPKASSPLASPSAYSAAGTQDHAVAVVVCGRSVTSSPPAIAPTSPLA